MAWASIVVVHIELESGQRVRFTTAEALGGNRLNDSLAVDARGEDGRLSRLGFLATASSTHDDE